jgi:hypothetical protein
MIYGSSWILVIKTEDSVTIQGLDDLTPSEAQGALAFAKLGVEANAEVYLYQLVNE